MGGCSATEGTVRKSYCKEPGVHRKTVITYLEAGRPPVYVLRQQRRTNLTSHMPHLIYIQDRAERRNGVELHQNLTDSGKLLAANSRKAVLNVDLKPLTAIRIVVKLCAYTRSKQRLYDPGCGGLSILRESKKILHVTIFLLHAIDPPGLRCFDNDSQRAGRRETPGNWSRIGHTCLHWETDCQRRVSGPCRCVTKASPSRLGALVTPPNNFHSCLSRPCGHVLIHLFICQTIFKPVSNTIYIKYPGGIS